MSKLPAWNPYGKFIILFNNPNGRDGGTGGIDGRDFAMKVLHFMFIEHHSVNVVFAFGTRVSEYELYTGDPYHGDETECGTYIEYFDEIGEYGNILIAHHL